MNKALIIGGILVVGAGAGYYLYSEDQKKKLAAAAKVVESPKPTYTKVTEVKNYATATANDLKDGKIDNTQSYINYVAGANPLSLASEQYLADQAFLNNPDNFKVNPDIDLIANINKRKEILKTDYTAQKAEVINQQAIVTSQFTSPNQTMNVTLNKAFLENPIEVDIPMFVNPTLRATVLVSGDSGFTVGQVVSGQWKNPDCFEVKAGGLLVCFKPSQIKIIPQADLSGLRGYGTRLL